MEQWCERNGGIAVNALQCSICGVPIRINDYNKNASSFVEKNKENQIKYCPFCGSTYFGDILNTDKEKLDQKSLRILDHAMKLEVFNSEFYKEASRLADVKEAKTIFDDLSHIESMHAQIHRRLGGFSKLPKLHKPDYSKHTSTRMLFSEAKKREHHAIRFYEKNLMAVQDSTIKQVFKALSEVEKQHEVLSRYYEGNNDF